jgi:uncharacterized membrane protein
MRVFLLDLVRTLAIISMVIFHTNYDLKMFHLVPWDFNTGFWYAFPRVIAFCFLYCVGVSLYLTHAKTLNWPSLKKRALKLGLSSLLISIVTYFLFPSQWVYFGTLHCIFLGSILGAPLVNRRKLSLLLFFTILTGQYLLDYDIKWISSILQRPSMDFIPLYPWFWVILLGSLTAPYLMKISTQIAPQRIPNWMSWPSKNSLEIYLIHQPLIFGSIWLYKQFS